LSGSWPSPFSGLRGKKLPVAVDQLLLDALPLADQEVPHHRLALGQRLGFEVIEGGLLLKGASIQGWDLNAVQFGHAFGLCLVLNTLDHDA
jgi:hypothetical protein